ncbi:MAG: hypothetical protein U0871_20575 [Gemmataceae bacterium]
MTSRITTPAAFTLVAGLAHPAAAQKVGRAGRKPVAEDVNITTPTGADAAEVQAEPVAWPKPANGPAPTGVVVKDAQGKTVRQFIDTTGRNQPNIFSYFLNGQEAYREIDANQGDEAGPVPLARGRQHQSGADADEDGTWTPWYVLSPEEASQELFAALAAKDMKRFQQERCCRPRAGAEAGRAAGGRDRQGHAEGGRGGEEMADTAAALNLSAEVKWNRLELGIPRPPRGARRPGRPGPAQERHRPVRQGGR